MSHKDEGLKTRHRQYWKKIEADSVVLDPGIIAISWEDSTIRLHDGYTIGGRIFPMSPAPSLTVNVLTPLSGNGSVSSPIALNIAALANQVPVLANAPITGNGIIGNPLDIDIAALAAALTNQVGVAHNASLVGNGTAGAPLSVNWGLAPFQAVSHDGSLTGTGSIGTPLKVVPAFLAQKIAVAAISPITGDGTTASPLTLDVPSLLPSLHNNITVVTDGTTVTGSGTVGNPIVAVPAVATVVTAMPIIGNGTFASPIDINIVSAISEIAAAGGVPVTHDTTMTGNGTTSNPLSVNWSTMPAINVQHDISMTGQGTAGNPLSVNWAAAPAINVQHDATLAGQGTSGSPLSVVPSALANQIPVLVGAGLSGSGIAGNPIIPNPATLGPLLANLVPIYATAPLTGLGTSVSPLGIVNASGALRGVVQLATSAEGLQPGNDVDATTPAYVAAAIAAIPADMDNQTAAQVSVAPTVLGQNNVQNALEHLAASSHVPAVNSTNNTALPYTFNSTTQTFVVGFDAVSANTQILSVPANVTAIKAATLQTAAEVSVSPLVHGQDNVQAALQAIDAQLATFVNDTNATQTEVQNGTGVGDLTASIYAAAAGAGINYPLAHTTVGANAITGVAQTAIGVRGENISGASYGGVFENHGTTNNGSGALGVNVTGGRAHAISVNAAVTGSGSQFDALGMTLSGAVSSFATGMRIDNNIAAGGVTNGINIAQRGSASAAQGAYGIYVDSYTSGSYSHGVRADIGSHAGVNDSGDPGFNSKTAALIGYANALVPNSGVAVLGLSSVGTQWAGYFVGPVYASAGYTTSREELKSDYASEAELLELAKLAGALPVRVYSKAIATVTEAQTSADIHHNRKQAALDQRLTEATNKEKPDHGKIDELRHAIVENKPRKVTAEELMLPGRFAGPNVSDMAGLQYFVSASGDSVDYISLMQLQLLDCRNRIAELEAHIKKLIGVKV